VVGVGSPVLAPLDVPLPLAPALTEPAVIPTGGGFPATGSLHPSATTREPTPTDAHRILAW
jgi:hypothetical protein